MGGGGQGGWEWRIEAFVKIKKNFFFLLGGGGGGGGVGWGGGVRVDVNGEVKFFGGGGWVGVGGGGGVRSGIGVGEVGVARFGVGG